MKTKTINILAIGNSFSQDACAYLHQTANAAGISTKVVNLYIGGCPLELHWQNAETGAQAYEYELNGHSTGTFISLEEALDEENWDVITLQQASHDSGWLNSYEPFLGLLLGYIKERAPMARILLHETWAYDASSTHPRFARYHRDQSEMYERLHECYSQMSAKYGLTVIPCGTLIQQMRSLAEFNVSTGGRSLCRDGFHMSLDYGRYLLSCVWLRKILGVSVVNNTFIPDNPALPEIPEDTLLNLIRNTVDTFIQ